MCAVRVGPITWVLIVLVCSVLMPWCAWSMRVRVGPVTWVILTEIFPLQIRGLAVGVCDLTRLHKYHKNIFH